ncbi:hypothetical protein KQX54_001771 [Cotesia glomerata]|uniref:Uncharacterized protein n=1 Tax=Cotesia glomerata TaxID=32391 RepID=A0AAV7IEU0_COTGL|nr:hypothetical protein KQX54_001771 [Cotesia glomerata]
MRNELVRYEDQEVKGRTEIRMEKKQFLTQTIVTNFKHRKQLNKRKLVNKKALKQGTATDLAMKVNRVAQASFYSESHWIRVWTLERAYSKYESRRRRSCCWGQRQTTYEGNLGGCVTCM